MQIPIRTHRWTRKKPLVTRRLGVIAIDVAAALNYRLNYYDQVPRPSGVDVVHALDLTPPPSRLPVVAFMAATV